MDIQTILQAVSSVGFPIVCCVCMGWYVKYTADKNREELSKVNEQHKQEMAEVTTAINNNTIALTQLCDFIKGSGDDGK